MLCPAVMVCNGRRVVIFNEGLEVFSFSIMKSSFCFTDVEIIAVQATGFVNCFRFLRTIQAVLVWKERFDEAIRENVVHRHRLVHTRMRDRTRVHIKSIAGIEAHVRRAVLALAGLKYLCNTSERKQGGLIITGGEVHWHC